MRFRWIAGLLLWVPSLIGSPVGVVMIDSAAEKQLGGFPVSRVHLADAIERLNAAGARAIVLKFFLDRAREPEGDERLEAAIRASRAPVVLQARLDPDEPDPNPLFAQHTLPGLVVPTDAAWSANSGWLPLARFASAAKAVGIIDQLNPAPILAVYRGRVVPSLYLVAVEHMLGGHVKVHPGARIEYGNRSVPLDAKNRVALPWPERDDLVFVPFLDLTKSDPQVRELRDKVVVVAYDGAKMHRVNTPKGAIKAHRLFCYELAALYEMLVDPTPALPP